MRLRERLKKIPGLARLVRLCRIAFSSAYRNEWRLHRHRPGGLFQPYGKTSFDRHPRIFSFVQQHLAGVSAPRLLSFGCSTGEEVFTLRRYFPHAEIVGVDINPHSIRLCRKQLSLSSDGNIRFELADSPDAEPDSSYDAVFCLSVLRHGDLGIDTPASCEHLIRFADFEKLVAGFARVLRPGGYLAIRHSNFRLADTASAAEFEALLRIETRLHRQKTPLYDRNNRLLEGVEYDEVLFRKRDMADMPAGR